MLPHKIVIRIVEPSAGGQALRLLEKTRCEHARRCEMTAWFVVDATSRETARATVEAQLDASSANWGSALNIEP